MNSNLTTNNNWRYIASPKEIFSYLDTYVEGQSAAKQILSCAGFLHDIRNEYSSITMRDLKRTHILLYGSTGSGKTYLVQKLAEFLGRPFIHVDCKSLVTSGYKGTDFEEVVMSNMGVANTSTGVYGLNETKINVYNESIVLLDEFDKLCSNTGLKNGFDIPIQQNLLRIVEGTTLSRAKLNTGNMLFIFSGSFHHATDTQKPPIGFNSKTMNEVEDTHKFLIRNGVIRELAGRISQITKLETLTRQQLRNILLKKEDSILKQYVEIFKYCGEELKISDKAINLILDNAIKKGTGARGIQTALEEVIFERVFKIKSNNLTY